MCICVGALFYLCVHRNVISTRSENFPPNSFPSSEGGKIAVINFLANWLIEKSENIVWRRNCEIGKIGKIMENGFLCQLFINLLCFCSIWNKSIYERLHQYYLISISWFFPTHEKYGSPVVIDLFLPIFHFIHFHIRYVEMESFLS